MGSFTFYFLFLVMRGGPYLYNQERKNGGERGMSQAIDEVGSTVLSHHERIRIDKRESWTTKPQFELR